MSSARMIMKLGFVPAGSCGCLGGPTGHVGSAAGKAAGYNGAV
jgi:hypothetical protein